MVDRELRFEQKMSDAEAMMWNAEHDPRLSSNIGAIAVCDRPLDADYFRKKLAVAVAEIPRLRERVLPVLGRLAPPVWVPDPEFDLDEHFLRVALPPPGDERQLFDLCCALLREPFDRTRPLWTFVVIDGLSGGRGALFSKLHHTITDGEGGVRLAERYMDLSPDPQDPPEVDLQALVARDAVPQKDADLPSALAAAAGHTIRRLAGIARRSLGELALAVADPPRVLEGLRNLTTLVESATSQLAAAGAGSPLWRERSRRRAFDAFEISLEPARAAAKALGGSLNDFFVTGAVMGAVAYHEFYGVEAPYFNVTFIVSTRNDASAGGNAFSPTIVRVDAGKLDPRERFARIRDAMALRRTGVRSGADVMGAVAGLANLLPTSVVTSLGRQQAARIDFATSNVRGAPLEVWVGRARCTHFYPMGPVAGTAWNITMMSYAGRLFMGVHADEEAVADLHLLLRSLRNGYCELLAAAGVEVGEWQDEARP